MFDLEQAILDWRKQMLAVGIKPSALEELEGHLREETEAQVKLGLSEPQAFEMAVDQIGQAMLLKEEFMKTGETKWAILRRLKTMFLGFPLPSSEDFATTAKQNLELATEEARGFHHNFVGTEHILLSLIKSNSGIVSKVMRRLGVESEAVRMGIKRFVGHGPMGEVSVKIPFTPRARKALWLAADTARALNQPCIKAEHIFLGLILEGDGVAGRVLKNFGVQIESAWQAVSREIDSNPGAA